MFDDRDWAEIRPQNASAFGEAGQGMLRITLLFGTFAIAIALYDGKAPAEILNTDANTLFEQLGLKEHLTAQRSNGLRALVDRIRADAQAIAAAA